LTELVTRDGWLMPAAVNPKLFQQWLAEAEERIELALPFVKERRCAVQAGGNLGYWPRLLAEKYGFDMVLTFEPDPVNYECLEANACGMGGWRGKVAHAMAALGDRIGPAPWSRASEHKPGWHKVAPNGCRPKYVSGTVWVDRLDNDAPDYCDFLALDVEGYELEALKGAEQTIARCRPVVLFEDMGRSRFEGFRKRSTVAYGNPPGAVQRWLAERGYREVASVKNDEVHAPVETLA
jgi:FkbM family methyltransferase